ncbi:hypothetical protein FOA43_001715 [Brettanomyces nanus]|uniref:Uncharacterized protein n=1 Tax=Eeniella nana TaxID=13502 RepID=A0A875S091_EENNA|nr:uncharacterized protein FOA43_001715 [Brettanomyces nanus]QPG74388.1 hypothetical protein FOA43_001715 [Brettanomyces nanus]
MTDQLSNADTAVRAGEQNKDESSAPMFDPEVLPPRTGFLRINWYKRSGRYRQFPTSCAAGCALVAVSLFSLGLILCGAENVSSPSILSGLLFFSSGLVEIITGIWAIVDNNLFGSTFLLCYGAFFMSIGSILCDLFGVASSYDSTDDLNNALGIFLCAWLVFTFFMWLATIKSTIPIFALMTFLFCFFLLYTIATFGNHSGCKTTAGIFCFLTSACAFYAMWDGLSANANAYVLAPEFKWTRMPGARDQPTDISRIEIV